MLEKINNLLNLKKAEASTLSNGIKQQDIVYIIADYHADHDVSPVEVPRFGWMVK
jgi:hypothetical protein